jgi:hypothetical protein
MALEALRAASGQKLELNLILWVLMLSGSWGCLYPQAQVALACLPSVLD